MQNTKGFIASFLLGAITILIIGGGFYIYQALKKNPDTQPIQNVEVSGVNSSGTPRTNPAQTKSATLSEIDTISPSSSPVGARVTLKTKKYSYCTVEPIDGCMGDRNLDIVFEGNGCMTHIQTARSYFVNSSGYKTFEFQVPTTLEPGTYRVGVSGCGKTCFFIGNPATFTILETKTPSITIVQPNNGMIPYGNVVMAGDILIQWKANDPAYIPSKLFKAYIIDAKSTIVRDDPAVLSIIEKEPHIFQTSFVGEKNLVKNEQYKVKICDTLNGKEYCDISDDFFTLN